MEEMEKRLAQLQGTFQTSLAQLEGKFESHATGTATKIGMLNEGVDMARTRIDQVDQQFAQAAIARSSVWSKLLSVCRIYGTLCLDIPMRFAALLTHSMQSVTPY